MHASLRFALATLFVSMLTSSALAQFNNPWTTFVKDTQRIRNPDGSGATHVTADIHEKDYAFGDVNNDGSIDLVVVRRVGWTSAVPLPNQLLMNEGGVLVDRTSQYATDSDVVGDLGFMTPTNDRDVQIVDLTGDGWPEIVTAVTQSDGQPKHISHPRVYFNKGLVAGVWQGFRYENARIPQLVTIPAGSPVAPRFTTVLVGDVTHDGFADLYFVDHDSNAGSNELPANDLNDRLLINNGFGVFVDSLETRMTNIMLRSGWGTAGVMLDINSDGARDVLRLNSATVVSGLSLAYGDPLFSGTFTTYQPQILAPPGAPYHVDAGDLNRDGRPDIVVSDDGADSYRINLGNDVSGNAIWGPGQTYNFLSGSDGGFGGNIRIVDLDGDNWPDTIHADVDHEVVGCDRRCGIYHNLGGAIGSQVALREEVQMPGTSGWKGAVGLTVAELTGTFDIATFDIDNDGDIDLVFGRCSGTSIWINQRAESATVFCLGDGSGVPCPCGNASTSLNREGCLSSHGYGARLRLSGEPSIATDTMRLVASQVPNGPALFFQGTWAVGGGAGSPLGDGLVCAGGAITRLGVVFGANNTSLYPRPSIDPAISVQSALAPGDSRTYQAAYRDSDLTFCTSATFNLTNALAITWH